MTISNATLLRVDTPQTADAAGVVALTTGAAISARCVLVEPRWSELRQAEALKVTVTAMLYVLRSNYAGTFALGMKVNVQQDGGTATDYFVRTLASPTKAGGLTHWQLGLEAA